MGYNPIHGVAFQGRADATTVLIQHGVPVDDAHEDGYTPLHRTVWGMTATHRHSEGACEGRGADPDGTHGHGLPPSHRAASRGWKEMVEALLELGADATLQAGESGDTLLHVAVRSQSVEPVGAVLRGGGDAGAKNAKGTTARGLAQDTAFNRHPQAVIRRVSGCRRCRRRALNAHSMTHEYMHRSALPNPIFPIEATTPNR